MRTTDTVAVNAGQFATQCLAMGKALGFDGEILRLAFAELCNNGEKSEKVVTTTDFVVPLGDEALPENLKPPAQKWRALATKLGYDGPVAWRVRAGFTLKQHAPKAGPCYQGFQYLQGWNFTDEPTRDAVVFWIPRLVSDSTNRTVPQQKALLADLRREFGLPETHLASFGRPSLLAALIFAYYKATGERVPLNCYWVRTDICLSDGHRLDLGFDEDGLYCDYWRWDDVRNPFIGVFAMGVEALGS